MSNTLRNYKNQINMRRGMIKHLEAKKEKSEKQKEILDLNSENLKEAREIIQAAALITQNSLAKHISTIVTKSLQSVFTDMNLEFSIKFEEGRGKTEANIQILEDGEDFDIFYDRGFGVADVISFSMRVAYILLSPVDRVVIIDEPFRNCSIDLREDLSLMVKELSENLGIQFIISTHMDELKTHADKVISVQRKKKISHVEIC